MDLSNISKFPSFFPCECPPNFATSGNFDVFRAVKNYSNLTLDDFYPQIVTDSNREDVQKNPCSFSSISVFTNVSDLKLKQEKFKALKKKYPFIAYGKITEDSGVVKISKNDSHIDWWVNDITFNKLPSLFLPYKE